MRIGIAALASSVLFCAVTDSRVWATWGMYSMSLQGLIACYVAAMAFVHNTLLGNAFYSVVLAGGFAPMLHYAARLRATPTV